MKTRLAILIILCIVLLNISSCGKETEVVNTNLERGNIIDFKEREEVPDEINIKDIGAENIEFQGEKNLFKLR